MVCGLPGKESREISAGGVYNLKRPRMEKRDLVGSAGREGGSRASLRVVLVVLLVVIFVGVGVVEWRATLSSLSANSRLKDPVERG